MFIIKGEQKYDFWKNTTKKRLLFLAAPYADRIQSVLDSSNK